MWTAKAMFALAGLFAVILIIDYLHSRHSELPALRPKIAPVRWGKMSESSGLILRNYGEPAFDISIDEPIAIGAAILDFRKRTHQRLTQADGELIAEACIRRSQGSLTSGRILRETMVEAGLRAISLVIRYRDFDGRQCITKCDVLTESLGNGLRIANVRQECA